MKPNTIPKKVGPGIVPWIYEVDEDRASNMVCWSMRAPTATVCPAW